MFLFRDRVNHSLYFEDAFGNRGRVLPVFYLGTMVGFFRYFMNRKFRSKWGNMLFPNAKRTNLKVSVTNLSLYASPVTFHSNNFVLTKKCMFKIAIRTLELTLAAVKYFCKKAP